MQQTEADKQQAMQVKRQPAFLTLQPVQQLMRNVPRKSRTRSLLCLGDCTASRQLSMSKRQKTHSTKNMSSHDKPTAPPDLAGLNL